jgi:hypothetical protein
MMYRSGWGSKPSQEVTLAIWLKRAAFERMLGQTEHSQYIEGVHDSKEQFLKSSRQKLAAAKKPTGLLLRETATSSVSSRCCGTGPAELVRLQWDPDHLPNGHPHSKRRAIQLGLKVRPAL